MVELSAEQGLSPARPFTPLVELSGDERADSALKRVHRLLFERILANEDGVRAFSEGEYLHDFRVAVRRTRTGLRQVRRVYPRSVAGRASKEFRWLSKVTGGARDLEVFRQAIDSLDPATDGIAPTDLASLRTFLLEHETHLREACSEALAGERYRRLTDGWRRFLDQPVDADGPRNAARPIAEVAGESISRAYERVARRGAVLEATSEAEAFHRVRLDCKKLRYLLEFFGSVFDAGDVGNLVSALKGAQENLGTINDLRFQADWIDRAPERSDAVRTLASHIGDRQHRERRAFVDSFALFIDEQSRRRIDRMLAADSRS